jgi:hypothetical protein
MHLRCHDSAARAGLPWYVAVLGLLLCHALCSNKHCLYRQAIADGD